jgi:hypothetical protein
MSWKKILKMHCNKQSGEKMDCSCAKCREKTNKALVGNQKRIDVAKPKGRITRADFDKLREEKKAMKSDAQIEKEILAEIKKEGGALGMKNLKAIAPPKELKRILDAMKRKKVIFMHKDGDIYTHSPR